MYNILIAENIPVLNKGELALLKGMIESFSPLKSVKIKIVSSSVKMDSERYGDGLEIIDVRELFYLKEQFNYSYIEKILFSGIITIKHILFLVMYKILGKRVTNIMTSELWKSYINADFIFIGHNGIFGIGSGLLGNYFNLLSLSSYIYLPYIGKTLKKPLVIYGGSIPQYKNFLTRKWMAFLLNRITLITLREKKSLENLLSIGYNGDRAFVTADLAFLLNPADKIESIMQSENINTNSLLIGITVTRYKAITAYKSLNTRESYKKHSILIANVLDFLVETKNAEVIFIPHSLGLEKHLDDRILSEYIFDKCKNKERIKVIKNEYSAEELKALIGKCDFFIGERLHSVIGAMSMNVPSIVLSNISDQRLDIIREIGQNNAICFVEELKQNHLIQKIEEMWLVREQIKKDLETEIKNAKERSMQNGFLLKELVKDFSG